MISVSSVQTGVGGSSGEGMLTHGVHSSAASSSSSSSEGSGDDGSGNANAILNAETPQIQVRASMFISRSSLVLLSCCRSRCCCSSSYKCICDWMICSVIFARDERERRWSAVASSAIANVIASASCSRHRHTAPAAPAPAPVTAPVTVTGAVAVAVAEAAAAAVARQCSRK